MKMNKQLSTPVLFLIYNRPSHTSDVFSAIRKVRPKYLYIAADGPRADKPEDILKCEKTREITKLIDWNCEVHTLFLKNNKGCRKAVSNALNWFFEHVEEGIILEDDCYPSLLFFDFCEQMLKKYKKDSQVMHIGGNNFQDNDKKITSSHYLSKIPHYWGWATWRESWKKYDSEFINLKGYLLNNNWREISEDIDICNHWISCFYDAWINKVDSWAYRWCFTIHFNRGLCISPTVNLVENVGFGPESTHTGSGYCPKITQISKIEFQQLDDDITRSIDLEKDNYTYINLYDLKKKKHNWLVRLKKIIKRRYQCKSRRKEMSASHN